MAAILESPAINRVAAFFNSPESENIADAGRDHEGKFKNGNRGGPGNPFARRVSKLRQAMLEECAEEDLRAITRAMIESAKEGNTAAAKLVFQYVLGKPEKMVHPDRIDEDELDVMKGVTVPPSLLEGMLDGVPADMVNRLIQIMWPATVKAVIGKLKQELADAEERDKETAEMEAEFEALPAEEKLKLYAAGQVPPPPELVEQAAREASARAAGGQQVPSSPVGNPSPNGIFENRPGAGQDGRPTGQPASPKAQPPVK